MMVIAFASRYSDAFTHCLDDYFFGVFPILKSAPDHATGKPPVHAMLRKASVFQVAATMICGIFAIGAKGTWQKDGATVTFTQVIVAAAITLIVLVSILVALVEWAVH